MRHIELFLLGIVSFQLLITASEPPSTQPQRYCC